MLTKIKSLLVSSSFVSQNINTKAKRIESLISNKGGDCKNCTNWDDSHWSVEGMDDYGVCGAAKNNDRGYQMHAACNYAGISAEFMTRGDFGCKIFSQK